MKSSRMRAKTDNAKTATKLLVARAIRTRIEQLISDGSANSLAVDGSSVRPSGDASRVI